MTLGSFTSTPLLPRYLLGSALPVPRNSRDGAEDAALLSFSCSSATRSRDSAAFETIASTSSSGARFERWSIDAYPPVTLFREARNSVTVAHRLPTADRTAPRRPDVDSSPYAARAREPDGSESERRSGSGTRYGARRDGERETYPGRRRAVWRACARGAEANLSGDEQSTCRVPDASTDAFCVFFFSIFPRTSV